MYHSAYFKQSSAQACMKKYQCLRYCLHMAKHDFDHLANKPTISKFQGFEPTQTDLDSVVMTAWLRPVICTSNELNQKNRYRKCPWANDYSEGFRIDKDRPSECVEFKKHADQSHGNDMAKII
ncbi:hypothetical protein C8R48DRAFT_676769 [Suillus tomentosus]|nr:hypothetical protein C8R48DRAFT_679715 [Suillus tomentosus]KAG1850244.1 hypothetical protein C8R48DRAFT_676768 [Suillus tomentosus]KAG1850246.1 hypothetical protein C8R48DRAFT_676769 [Suillus tomentosus]